jgi:hypothetical protein
MLNTYSRSFDLALIGAPTVRPTVYESAWKTAVDTANTFRRYRVIGSVHATISDAGAAPQDALYMAVQIEERFNCGTESTYSSRIILGSLINKSQEHLPFKTRAQGLWCSKCWSDNIYGTGEGGIEIPYYAMGPHNRRLTAVPTCRSCGCYSKPYDAEDYRPLTSGQAHLFSAVMCRQLQLKAEEAFAAAGVVTGVVSRSEECVMPSELQEAIRGAAVAAC